MDDFKEFDRNLEDFRSDMALAHLTIREAVKRYLAMMDVLHTMFLLYYEDMSPDEQVDLLEAFTKLADTVACLTDDSDDKVVPLKEAT